MTVRYPLLDRKLQHDAHCCLQQYLSCDKYIAGTCRVRALTLSHSSDWHTYVMMPRSALLSDFCFLHFVSLVGVALSSVVPHCSGLSLSLSLSRSFSSLLSSLSLSVYLSLYISLSLFSFFSFFFISLTRSVAILFNLSACISGAQLSLQALPGALTGLAQGRCEPPLQAHLRTEGFWE